MNEPQYVYVLANYDESGLEDRVATVDRSSAPVLLDRFTEGYDQNNRAEATSRLSALLQQSDDELSKDRHDLMTGWGGVQLYVLKLQ